MDLISIGNEIRNGILWPVGEINCTDCGGWDNLAQLLKAGVAGAQAGNPAGHKLLVMMHYDQGGDNALSSAFYSQLTAHGVPFDVIGLSYYPFFHGAISAMRANVDALATQFRKPIVIAETQYPWTLANGNSPLGDSTGNFVWQTSQLSPGYPASPGGQLSFVTDELSILAQVPGGLGAGLFYWAPDWIPGVPWEPGANIGSPNVNLTLFNFEGAALPSIGIFQNPAGVCERHAPDSSPCSSGLSDRLPPGGPRSRRAEPRVRIASMETPLSPLEFARRTRRLHADREAVVDGDLRLTYRQFFDRCDRWSSALQGLGVAQGDRVATISPNTHAQLESFYSVPQLGAVLVPINYRLTAEDFVYIVNHSGATVLCVAEEYLAAVDGIRDRMPGVEHFVALDGSPPAPGTAGSTTRRRWRPPIPASTGRRSANGT